MSKSLALSDSQIHHAPIVLSQRLRGILSFLGYLDRRDNEQDKRLARLEQIIFDYHAAMGEVEQAAAQFESEHARTADKDA